MPAARSCAFSGIGIAVAVVTSLVGCGGSPTSPNTSGGAGNLQLACPGMIFVGQTVACMAALVNGGSSIISVTASYGGHSASVQVSVNAQDVLQVSAFSFQGIVSVGNVVTMWLQGFYGVASADSGLLSLVISDQTGKVIATGSPTVVPRGGDSFIVSATFTVTPGATQVCRTAVLQIGSDKLTATGSSDLSPCLAVVP